MLSESNEQMAETVICADELLIALTLTSLGNVQASVVEVILTFLLFVPSLHLETTEKSYFVLASNPVKWQERAVPALIFGDH